jgi:hypothetical protein
MWSLTNGKKVINLPKLPRNEASSWFWDVIKATRLEPPTRTNYNIIDHDLMTTFAERWHSKTNTFHLPIGEVGITLDDVQCPLHLPITGPFLNHDRLRRIEGVELVHKNLGIDDILSIMSYINQNSVKPHISPNDGYTNSSKYNKSGL